ncbi:MAG: hypothetical protein AAFV19_10280 [Pseudomonadota bacterium]
MPEFGFPAQPRNATLSSLIANLRSRSDDARVASVSGRFADVTAERNGRVNELMQIEKSLNDFRTYSEIIALTEVRTTTIQASLSKLTGEAQSLADTVDVLRTNGTAKNFSVVSADAVGALDSVIAALNADVAGRRLFGGDETGTAPLVDGETIRTASVPTLEAGASAASSYTDLRIEFFAAGGLFDTTFYQGGAGDAPVTEVAPGERVEYGVKADDAAVREVLFNITVLSASHDLGNAIPSEAREELAALASAGLRSAVSELANVQGRVGTAEARVATAKARNIASEASLTISFNELAGADQFEAALTLTELDNQLETAFLTTSRLTNLSLANFL